MNADITLSDYEELKRKSEHLFLHRKYLMEEVGKRDRAEENIAAEEKFIGECEAAIRSLVKDLGLGGTE